MRWRCLALLRPRLPAPAWSTRARSAASNLHRRPPASWRRAIKLLGQLACPVWAMSQVPMVGQKRVGHICCQLCSRQCAPVFAAAAVAAQLCRITFLMDASLISRPQPWLSGTPCRRQRRARCRPAALFDDPSSSSNGAGSNPAPPQQQGSRILDPIFPEPQRAAAKPLPVQTQRGVPTFKPSIADPPCLLCSGSGKVTCGDCRCGRGCRGSGSWHRQPGFGLRDAALANPACSWQAAVAPFSCIPAGT